MSNFKSHADANYTEEGSDSYGESDDAEHRKCRASATVLMFQRGQNFLHVFNSPIWEAGAGLDPHFAGLHDVNFAELRSQKRSGNHRGVLARNAVQDVQREVNKARAVRRLKRGDHWRHGAPVSPCQRRLQAAAHSGQEGQHQNCC